MRILRWLLLVSMFGCVAPTAEAELLERVQKERACTADKLKVTYLGASAYRVEGCGPPETFICVSYQGWVCTREGAGQSSRRVLGMVATLEARSAAEVPAPPPQVQVPEPPVYVPYIYVPPPPPPPPPTF